MLDFFPELVGEIKSVYFMCCRLRCIFFNRYTIRWIHISTKCCRMPLEMFQYIFSYFSASLHSIYSHQIREHKSTQCDSNEILNGTYIFRSFFFLSFSLALFPSIPYFHWIASDKHVVNQMCKCDVKVFKYISKCRRIKNTYTSLSNRILPSKRFECFK